MFLYWFDFTIKKKIYFCVMYEASEVGRQKNKTLFFFQVFFYNFFFSAVRSDC